MLYFKRDICRILDKWPDEVVEKEFANLISDDEIVCAVSELKKKFDAIEPDFIESIRLMRRWLDVIRSDSFSSLRIQTDALVFKYKDILEDKNGQENKG